MATRAEGTLKEHIGAHFNGKSVNDLPKFLTKFNLGCQIIEAKPEKKHLLLLSHLAGNAWDVGSKFVQKWGDDNPTHNMNAAEKRDNAQRCYEGLVEVLKTDPLVTGVKPVEKLLDKLHTLTQGDGEEVSVYHNRFTKLLEQLAGQEPPQLFTELQKYNTFVGATNSIACTCGV